MQVLNIFHVLIAITLVAFVLIQRGQGATAGAAFGSGASGTVFGARGAGNFLSRTTWVLAALFCTISLTMAVMVSRTAQVPENDLGVLGSSQAAPETNAATENSVISVGADESSKSDLPSFDTAADTVNSEENMINQVADDLPGLDSVVNDAKAPAVDDGVVGEEPGSDSNDQE